MRRQFFLDQPEKNITYAYEYERNGKQSSRTYNSSGEMHLICVQYHLSLFTSPQSSHESLEYVCTTIIGEQNPKLHLRETSSSNWSVSEGAVLLLCLFKKGCARSVKEPQKKKQWMHYYFFVDSSCYKLVRAVTHRSLPIWTFFAEPLDLSDELCDFFFDGERHSFTSPTCLCVV